MTDKETESKTKILKAAKTEFAGRGFKGGRLSVIAERAGVNKALIHYYFTNKEGLYVAVMKLFMIGSRDANIPLYPVKWKLTQPQKLYVMIYFMVNTFLKATDPDIIRIAIWEFAEGKQFLETIMMEHNREKQELLIRVIKDGIKNGEFETENPRLLFMDMVSFMAFYVFNRISGMSKESMHHVYGNADQNAIFRFMIEHIFKALKPKGRRLTIPSIPDELKELLDTLLELQIKKADEGINDAIFRQIREILK